MTIAITFETFSIATALHPHYPAFYLNEGRFALIRQPIPNKRREQGCHGWPFTV